MNALSKADRAWVNVKRLHTARLSIKFALADVRDVAPRTAIKLRSALKSIDGAIRHQERLCRTASFEFPGAEPKG